MDIQKIDKNFLTRMPSGIDLRFYDADEVPFEVYGLLPHQQDEPYRRIPLQVGKESNIGVEYLSASTTGGRIRFRTNSRIVALSAEWPNLTRMNHMPLSGSSGFDLYVEEKGQAHYAKSLIPSMDSDTKLATNIIKSREKIRMTCLTPDPSSSPTNSGRLAPFRRTESIPDR